MKFSSRLLLALTGALTAGFASGFAAAPKVETAIIGPTNEGGAFTVSPKGAHVAFTGMKGTRFYVNVDGVAGPEFDALYKTSGPEFYFPPKVLVWRATESDLDGNDAPVRFSRDGSHYAYVGRQGEECVVIHDGKEVARYPVKSRAMPGIRLSPGGKHAFWNEAKPGTTDGTGRTVIMGKPAEWGVVVEPVFSPDDNHYAWAVPLDREGNSAVYLNGKNTGYQGQQPKFTADSKSLLVISNDGGASVLLDGKPVIKGGVQVSKIVVGPVGKRYAAIVRQMVNNKGIDFLYIDGKQVADSQHAQDVWFSPDGKRYAAVCRNPFGGLPAMIIDGDAYEFARIDPAPPLWTPDSSKVIFTAGNANGSVLVVNTTMIPYTGALRAPIVPEQGGRYAWGILGSGGGGYAVNLDGKSVLPGGVYPTSQSFFSPDGSRLGFTVGPVGRGETTGLVIDGALQPGIAPGPMWTYLTDGIQAKLPLAFSRDGQHFAYVGRSGAARKFSFHVDGKLVQPEVNTVYYPTFTPDNQHLFWVVLDQKRFSTLYLDGQPAVQANGYFFYQIPASFSVDPNGVATFLAQDGDVVKRFRVTPTADTSIATLLANNATAAVAVAPAAPSTPSATPPPALKPPTTVGTPPPAVGKLATPPPAAGPAVALTWNDLVRRPEAQPTTTTVNKDFNFQGGVKIRAGTKVNVLEVKPGELVVGTTDGRTTFGVKPDETDILAVANAAWAQLTPAQRELTYASLLQRPDLWPYSLKLTEIVRLDGQTLAVGESVQFLGFEGNRPLVRHERSGVLFNAETSQIDLMARARTLVASNSGAPGRLLEELAAARPVSPINGQAVALDLNARPNYVVLYRGAGWCGPCQTFSPGLVKLLKDKAPKAADVTLVYVSADKSAAEAKAYATKIGIDWPTIFYSRTDQLPAFHSLFGNAIPQLVVTDRHGKVVVDSTKVGTDRALQQLQQLLN